MHDVTAIEHVETMRDAFVSSAAHTLKTPVAVIDAQVDLLANRQTPSLEASTAAIRRQSARIARIVDNLLVLARIRSETLRLQPEAVDLANIVNEVAREMQTATADHRLSLNLQTRPMVFADRARLMLVIRNLIDLAYRRSLPRTTVALALEQDDSTGRVSVTYQSTTPIEAPTGSDVEAGFGGLGLERYVTEELVGAANGVMGADIPAANMRRDWIDIPVMEEHARA
jgi:signal transduction histidine kinase